MAHEGDVTQQKEVAFYATITGAWVQSRMEHDRALRNLSAGGIGLLVTLATTVGMQHWLNGLCYSLAVASFLVTIFFTLKILRGNSGYLQDVATNNIDSESSEELENLDSWSVYSFVAGVVLTLGAGLPFAAMEAFLLGG